MEQLEKAPSELHIMDDSKKDIVYEMGVLCELMNQPAVEDRSCASGSGSFPTTHWSAILAAGQDAGARADTALAELSGLYWRPIYVFARRQGHQPADAQDLTQEFFAHLIESHLVRKADPRKGRFRSFVLGCFTVFLASETRKATAEKRGGRTFRVPVDLERAEEFLAAEPSSRATPEQLFVTGPDEMAAVSEDLVVLRLITVGPQRRRQPSGSGRRARTWLS